MAAEMHNGNNIMQLEVAIRRERAYRRKVGMKQFQPAIQIVASEITGRGHGTLRTHGSASRGRKRKVNCPSLSTPLAPAPPSHSPEAYSTPSPPSLSLMSHSSHSPMPHPSHSSDPPPGFSLMPEPKQSPVPPPSPPPMSPPHQSYLKSETNHAASTQPASSELNTMHAASSSQQAPSSCEQRDNRHWIEPTGDTFVSPTSIIHEIRAIIESNFKGDWTKWSKISKDVKEMWWQMFKEKFRWEPQNENKIKKNFMYKGADRFRDMMRDARKSCRRPNWIPESSWKTMTDYWDSADFKKESDQNKINAGSGLGPAFHIGGSIPVSEHKRRLEKELGRPPSQFEVFRRTHQRNNASWVDDRSKQTFEAFEKKRAKSQNKDAQTNSGSELGDWVETVGGCKRGRIYGLGSQAHDVVMGGKFSSQTFPRPLWQQEVESRVASLDTEWHAYFNM